MGDGPISFLEVNNILSEFLMFDRYIGERKTLITFFFIFLGINLIIRINYCREKYLLLRKF